jgi:hypothetical protein
VVPADGLTNGFTSRLGYKPGWTFKMGGPGGQHLCVFARTLDSSDPTQERVTQHMRKVPTVDLTPREMIRWVFDFILDIERHEAGEWFSVEGHRPFMPHHQDEGDPYAHVERWD